MSKLERTNDDVIYSFFERFHYQELSNSGVNGYYFSSTRKRYNYYGIIVEILNNAIAHESNHGELIYTAESIQVYKTVFSSENYPAFAKHIKQLAIEEYVLNNRNKDGFYEIGTYPYTAIKLQFYVSEGKKIGSFYNKNLREVLVGAFQEIRFKYFSPESFALFCASEHLPLANEHVALLLANLSQYCITHTMGLAHSAANPWLINLGEKEAIVDIQNYAKGINGDLLFRHFPLVEIAQKNDVQIFSPAPKGKEWKAYKWIDTTFGWAEHEPQVRLLKVNKFKNSESNYWFIFLARDSAYDRIEYILGKLEQAGVKLLV